MKNDIQTNKELRSTYGALDNDNPEIELIGLTSDAREVTDRRSSPVPKRQKTSQQAGGDRLLTAREFAERLGVKRSTAYQWAYERRLPTVKLGRALRFRESEVEKFIRRNERPAIRPSLTGGD